jgi:hypothetical protein
VSVRRRFIPTLTAALTVLWFVSPATRGAGGDAMRLLPPHVTPKTADAIDRGLAFLARTQGRDGAWRNRTGYGGYPVAMSALAGLALLAGGNTTTQGPYAPNVDRVTDFLLGCRTPSGLIARMDEAEGRPMYGHGFATLFLAQVYGMTEDADRQARIREVLQRAVELTGRSQSPLGGWIYMPDGGGDEGSVTITQLQALRACRNAGIAVPKEVIDRALKYLELSFRSDGGIAYRARQSGPSRPPITAAAVCCWFNCGDYDNPMAKRALQFCHDTLGVGQGDLGHFYYAHLYYAQAIFLADQPAAWDRYFPDIRDKLLKQQRDDGSWMGDSVGLPYGTALATIILQLPYQRLPIMQR